MTRLIGVDAASELIAGNDGHRVSAFTRLIEFEGQPYYWVAGCGAMGTSPESPTSTPGHELRCIRCFPAASGAAS